MVRRQILRAVRKKIEKLYMQSGQELRRGEDLKLHRAQFQGQRQTVESRANGGHGYAVFVGQGGRRVHRLDALDKERYSRRRMSGSTLRRCSARRCSRSRLVAKIVSVGHAANKAAIKGPAPSICSRLSRTRRRER